MSLAAYRQAATVVVAATLLVGTLGILVGLGYRIIAAARRVQSIMAAHAGGTRFQRCRWAFVLFHDEARAEAMAMLRGRGLTGAVIETTDGPSARPERPW